MIQKKKKISVRFNLYVVAEPEEETKVGFSSS
jgi:hypothetical protein